jgi:hypothetical protein
MDTPKKADLHTAYANVAQVKASREEFMLLLGTSQTGPSAQKEIRVALNQQIIMSPVAAKRLSVLLNSVIHEYESRFGSLDNGVAFREELLPTPPLRPPSFRSALAVEKSDLCLRLLDRLNIKPAFERSFKFKEKSVLENRFLLGFEKDSIKTNPNEKILDICEQIGMPPDLMVTFLKNLPEASIVGFGFGENETTCIVKAYLEFGIRFYRAMKNKLLNPDPYLSHLGCKWGVSDNTKSVVTKYTCYPAYTTEDMLERLSSGLYKDKDSSRYAIVKGILELASGKVGNDKFLFLGVDEENNPRNSFDINLYRANLQIKDIYPFLLEMCRFYSISEKRFHELFEPIKTQIFGHIAGGIDRKGKDFFTIYFGEQTNFSRGFLHRQ